MILYSTSLYIACLCGLHCNISKHSHTLNILFTCMYACVSTMKSHGGLCWCGVFLARKCHLGHSHRTQSSVAVVRDLQKIQLLCCYNDELYSISGWWS